MRRRPCCRRVLFPCHATIPTFGGVLATSSCLRMALHARNKLGRVDELFDDNPRGHKMDECEKGLAQFLIPCGNASKLFEFVKEPFHLLP